MNRHIFLAALWFFLALPVAAETTRGVTVVTRDAKTEESGELTLYRNMWAVVIGIDKYPNVAPPHDLEYAVQDARGVAQVLGDRYAFTRIWELYNADATRSGVLKTLEEVKRTAGEDDAVFVFFAGHATQDNDVGYLVPSDGTLDPADPNDISMTTLKMDLSRKIRAKHVLYVVDACYGGLLLTRGAGIVPGQRDMGYLRWNAKEPVRMALSAGQPNQEVLDGGYKGHSVFTGRMIQALEAAPDYMLASELITNIKEKVYQDAQARGFTQTPDGGRLSGEGDFIFVPKPEVAVENLEDQLSRARSELEAARSREAESKTDDERRRLEAERVTAEASVKAEESRVAKERQLRARREEEQAEQSRRATEQSRRQEELSAELANVQKELSGAESSGTGEDATRAAARVTEINGVMTQIAAKYEGEKTKSLAAVDAYYGPKVADLGSLKKDEYETTQDFQVRLESERRRLKSDWDRERSGTEESYAKQMAEQTSPLKDELSELMGKAYAVSSGMRVTLGAYDADAGYFPVTIMATEVGTDFKKSEEIYQGRLNVPPAQARSVGEHRPALGVKLYRVVDPSGNVAEVAYEITDLMTKQSYFIPGAFDGDGRVTKTDKISAWQTTANVIPAMRSYAEKRVNVLQFEPDMVWIPAGSFDMGSNDGEGDEKPVHRVYVDGFWMGQYEVTVWRWGQFVNETKYRTEAEKKGYGYAWTGANIEEVSGANWRNPGFEQDDQHPVTQISWNDAVAYCEWLTRKMGTAYRLPTEAEWEYACRAGRRTKYYWGDNFSSAYQYANFADRNTDFSWSDKTQNDGFKNTSPVGNYDPNGSGLYDMSGNVWEWCQDWYGEKYYGVSPERNPTGPESGPFRVLRGGSWYTYVYYSRAALRYWVIPLLQSGDLGFRVTASSMAH